MNTQLQAAAQAVVERFDEPDDTDVPRIATFIRRLRKALADEMAQAVEPTTTKTEQIAGAISKHISTPLIQREVIAAAQYIAHRYMRPAPPAPPAGEQIDWQDMYKKVKSEKEAMAAKYEKDIGPLARVEPATGERAALIAELRDVHARRWALGMPVFSKAADMLEADGKAQQVAVPDGWALVPIEPTPEMIAAGGHVNSEFLNGHEIIGKRRGDWLTQGVYKAMLAAAHVAVPSVYAVVPIEPTGEMLVATDAHPGAWTELVRKYKLMLAATQGAKPETEIPASATKTDWSAA